MSYYSLYGIRGPFHRRVLYAFDPNQSVVLLLGGDKTGDDRWYKVNVPKADVLFDVHLKKVKAAKAPTKGGK
jgi:hypothetical protein